jgi:periplasmic protein TonB
MAAIVKIFFSGLFCTLFGCAAYAQSDFGPQEVPKHPVARPQNGNKTPDYPGGIDAFYLYLNTHFRKPEIDSTFTARILVSFVVETDGTMSAIKVLRDPGFGLGAETLRVLQNVPEKWLPGEMDGKKIRASYNLPITISFEEEPKIKKINK